MITDNENLDLNELARECFANSARWFPELHDTRIKAAMHFVVGFVGEIGEFLIDWDAGSASLREELADSLMYWFDLGAAYRIEIDSVLVRNMAGEFHLHEEGYLALPPLLRPLGIVANITKKGNRKNIIYVPFGQEDVFRSAYHDVLAWLYSTAQGINMNIAAEVERKRIICEERWGDRPKTFRDAIRRVVQGGDTPSDALARMNDRWPGIFPSCTVIDAADVFQDYLK